MTDDKKMGNFIDDTLTGLLQNSGLTDAVKQPIADINAAVTASNAAMAAWAKAVASIEAMLAQYGINSR